MATSLTNVNTSSVQYSVVSDSLWSHGMKYARLLSVCMKYARLSITNSQILLKFMSIELVMPSNHLILYCPQHQGLFKWVSSSHQVAKVLEFQPQHQSFQWIFMADFFWMDWLDLLAVQGTLKSLIQHDGSKASILQAHLSLYSNSHIHTWLLEKP